MANTKNLTCFHASFLNNYKDPSLHHPLDLHRLKKKVQDKYSMYMHVNCAEHH